MTKRLRSVIACGFAILAFSAAAAFQKDKDEPAPSPQRLPVLQKPAQWWKGNMHTHSLWSDGDDFPEMIADWYKTHGYHFLGLSDHNILSDGEKWVDAAADKGTRVAAVKKYAARFGDNWVERREVKEKPQVRLKPLAEFRSLLEEPGRFLMIPAEEVTHRFEKFPVHMNAINLRDVITPVSGQSTGETLRVNLRAVADQQKRAARPIFAFVNHPNFGWGVRAEDLLVAEELRAFEIFNGHPGVRNYGDETHPGVERMWDIVLALRIAKLGLPVVFGVATDDAHAYHAYGVGKTNPGRGWVMVKAPHLTAEAIVRALEKGDFYSSSGVTLTNVSNDSKELALSIQAEKGVTYKTQFIATLRDAPLESRPRLDKDGKELPVSRIYSDDVGKVVAESNGLTPSYRFTGKELYVRAKITSSKPHPNPYAKGDVECAWTQPVIPRPEN